MGLANAIANTFEIPRNPELAQAGARKGQRGSGQQAGGQGGSILGEPPSGIEMIEGITDKFYGKWAELESFAQDMQIQYGIDVTRPDFTSAEAMDAHKMFQQAKADLLYTGNELRQSQKELDLYNEAHLSSYGDRVDPGQEIKVNPFDASKASVRGIPKTPTGIVTEKDKWTREQDRIDAAQEHEWDMEKKALDKDTEDAGFSSYSQIMHEAGAIASGALKDLELGDDGMMHSPTWANVAIGAHPNKKTVKGVMVDPESGEAFLEMVNSDNRRVDPIPVTKANMGEIVTAYILGQGGEFKADELKEFQAWMTKNGKTNEDFVPKNAGDFAEARGKATVDRAVATATAQKDTIMEKIDTGSNKTKKELNDALVGEVVETVKGPSPVVKVERQTKWTMGKYKATMKNGEVISFGGSGGSPAARKAIEKVFQNKVNKAGGGNSFDPNSLN